MTRRYATYASSRAPSRTTCSSAKVLARMEARRMAVLPARLLKVALIVSILGGLYLLAEKKHAEREQIRQTAVELTPDCKAKLQAYELLAGEQYRSPYL